jgi:hypothetical protein
VGLVVLDASFPRVRKGQSLIVALSRLISGVHALGVAMPFEQGLEETGPTAGGVDEEVFCMFLLHPSTFVCAIQSDNDCIGKKDISV